MTRLTFHESLLGPREPRTAKSRKVLPRVLSESRGALRSGFECALINNSLMGSFGKGSLQKIFHKFPRNFRGSPQNFRTLSCRNKTHFLHISANFPQNFCKNPFANNPIYKMNCGSQGHYLREEKNGKSTVESTLGHAPESTETSREHSREIFMFWILLR